MLNEIDYKILNELSKDGRLGNAQLALKLGISATTVCRRVQAMIGEGVVSIKAVPNHVKLGYHFGAFIGLDVDLMKLDTILTHIVGNINSRIVVTCFGRFDIIIIAIFRDYEMVQNYISELQKTEGVNHVETYMGLESKIQQHIFNDNAKKSTSKLIDETDQILIEELMRNGRLKHAHLAKKLGIDTSTVSRRIAFLIKEDIMKIIGIPNPSKLGYSANAFVGLSADINKVDKIYSQLDKYYEVHFLMKLINGFEIMIGVQSPTTETLYGFMKNRIATIDGILNMETFIRGNYFYLNTDFMLLSSTEYPSNT